VKIANDAGTTLATLATHPVRIRLHENNPEHWPSHTGKGPA